MEEKDIILVMDKVFMSTIIKLSNNNPNDMDFGREVRRLLFKINESLKQNSNSEEINNNNE